MNIQYVTYSPLYNQLDECLYFSAACTTGCETGCETYTDLEVIFRILYYFTAQCIATCSKDHKPIIIVANHP